MMNNNQIDRLIAEKVYGWKTQEFKNIGVIAAYTEDGDELSIPNDFSPTSSIEAAWNVLKEIKEHKGIQADISTNNLSVKLYVWKEDKTPPYIYKETLATIHDTRSFNDFPLAICSAVVEALKKFDA